MMSSSVRLGDVINDPPYAVAMMCATKLGWRVLPLRGKEPRLKKWQDLATTDPEIITGWWEGKYLGADCGIATGPGSGIWVLDLDVKDGYDGSESLAELAAGRAVPETFTVQSSSGRGLHLYWAWPELDEGVSLHNSSGRLGRGLDVKGDRGQVRAPLKSSDVLDSRLPVPAPEWLLEEVLRASIKTSGGGSGERPSSWFDATAVITDAVSRIARAEPGKRNDTLNAVLFSVGRWVHETGVTESQAWDACRSGCRRNGLWAEEPEQCRATFNSAWFAGLAAAQEERKNSSE